MNDADQIHIDRARRALQWRALHSHVVDAVLNQDEDNSKGIQIVFGGMRLRDFAGAVEDGSRVRIRPLREDDGEVCFRVEVLDDHGTWQGLVRPPAEALGMYPHEAQFALQDWFARAADLPPDPEIEE
jgi:hypothetical protein